MNVVLVDPIAATANVTARGVFRPEVPSLGGDPRNVRETKVVELATEMARRGHRPTVVLGDVFLGGREWTLDGGVRVVPVSTIMRVPFHPGLFPATPALLSHPALRDADVIQVSEFHQPSTFFACVAAHERSIPLVVWQETFRHARFPGSVYQRAYESTAGRYVRSHARRFVLRTTNASAYLRRLQVAEGRIGPWIPTGIDVTSFAPRAPRLSPVDFGWSAGDPILLLVGRLHSTKGVDLALRTLKWVKRKYPAARLLVRGAGPEQGALARLARDLGIEDSTRFVERKSRAEMVDLYNLADVVVCTSRVDLMPFSLLEAAACGRPAVATNVGAIPDIVEDGRTGLLVQPTVPAIGAAVCSLLGDEGLRATFGSEARRRAEQRFALPVIVERFLEVYRDVAA